MPRRLMKCLNICLCFLCKQTSGFPATPGLRRGLPKEDLTPRAGGGGDVAGLPG